MQSKKKGFVLYFDNCAWLSSLDYEQKGKLFEALYQYAELVCHESVTPWDFLTLGTTEMNGEAMLAFGFMADNIYRDTAKWNAAAERRMLRKKDAANPP